MDTLQNQYPFVFQRKKIMPFWNSRGKSKWLHYLWVTFHFYSMTNFCIALRSVAGTRCQSQRNCRCLEGWCGVLTCASSVYVLCLGGKVYVLNPFFYRDNESWLLQQAWPRLSSTTAAVAFGYCSETSTQCTTFQRKRCRREQLLFVFLFHLT